MKIIKYLNSLNHKTRFFFLNLYCFLKIKNPIPPLQFDEKVGFSALGKTDIKEFICVYKHLNNSSTIDFFKFFLLKIFSTRSCFIAKDTETKKIIGINYYYFNKKDSVENSIHEAFIGVIEEYQKIGIATALRKHALNQLSKSNLKFVSTNISKNNIPSFNSAKKLGFEISEEWFDPVSNQKIYYLRFNLEFYRRTMDL